MLDPLEKDNELLANIKARWSELDRHLKVINSHSVYEDLVYRFYHQSFKVYYLQEYTNGIVEALKSLAPSGTTFSPMFEEIYQAGASGKVFEMKHNREWTSHTRVFVEAFLHAKYFLEWPSSMGRN